MEKLQAIGEHNEVKLIWIPGHEGHDGNERADALARQGATSTQDPNKVECSISLQLIKTRIKNWLYDTASSEWHKTNIAKHSKEIWKKYSAQKTNMLLSLNRNEVQRIVAFTTEHGKFRAHLRKMNISTESKCKYCDEDETAKHIMCVCDAYAALRQRTTGMMYCELKDYARLNFQMYRSFCLSAFERLWSPTNN